jgi:uridine kinase
MGHRPVFLGIAGGSGCGKTTVVGALVSGLAPAAHLPPRERARINFDHPDSLETSLLVEHLEALRQGNSVEVPTYDFATHTRRRRTESIHPTPVVIVDGILVLADPDLRSLMDIRIFIDTDPDLRFIRRLQRDVDERGRTHESVVDQYLATVRPMHLEFVEPSKRYADVIVPEGGFNRVAVEMIVARLQGILQTAPF